jgi:hypothetical protein
VVDLSSLRSKEDMEKVLKHPLEVVRGDVAGIERLTGILTDAKRLEALKKRVSDDVLTNALLASRQSVEFSNRLREREEPHENARTLSLHSSSQQVG